MRFAPAALLLLIAAPCVSQIVTGSMSGYGGPSSQTNDPVAMVFEHKQAQTLADGTHINMVTHEYFYRDSLGRTRTENESAMPWLGANAAMHMITVQDPVGRTFTSWQTGGPEGNPHVFNRFDQNPPRSMASVQGSNLPHPVTPVSSASATGRRTAKTTTEPLGMQDVQGVPCEASRITVVYPVDFMGNDRPITAVTERCQSREFGRALRDSTEDPRSGTRTTTLQTFSRGEPDPSLFQPPPDYIDARSGAR